MHIIFYGPEGSGKGTQAKLLSKNLHLPLLVSGDLVRDAAVNDKGLIGDAVRKALEEGKYVADTEIFVLWKKRLKENDVKNGWVMDGFPRNIDQAKFLTEKVNKYGYKIDKAFYLKISVEESMKRLIKRGRKLHAGSTEVHDSPERIKQRLAIYKENEKKVLDFFRKQKVLEEIDGEENIKKIHQDILSRLNEHPIS